MNMHKDVKLISQFQSGEKDIEIRSELVGSNSRGKRKVFGMFRFLTDQSLELW